MEPTIDNRKTFRLSDAAAESLATIKRNHSTENAAINHALVELPKQLNHLQVKLDNITKMWTEEKESKKQWQTKHDTLATELQQLKNSLALLGKLLHPAE